VAFLLFSKEEKPTLPDETITAKIEIEKPEKPVQVDVIPDLPKEKISAEIKIKGSQTKKVDIQSKEKLPIAEIPGKIVAEESREQGIILAELPRKIVVFEIVDELQVVRTVIKSEQEVELSELLKPQLAAIRKSDDMELLSTDHLALSGLQLVAKMSGNRLTAKRTANGEVKSVTFNTHLLAFTIPVKR
jgi:hypothetical protein